MCELFRVLMPNGWAILQVPIDTTREDTLEDPAIVDPADRLRTYGDEDHVRLYGRDYLDRLAGAGFTPHVDEFVTTLSPELVERCRIDPGEAIYRCVRPEQHGSSHGSGTVRDRSPAATVCGGKIGL